MSRSHDTQRRKEILRALLRKTPTLTVSEIQDELDISRYIIYKVRKELGIQYSREASSWLQGHQIPEAETKERVRKLLDGRPRATQ